MNRSLYRQDLFSDDFVKMDIIGQGAHGKVRKALNKITHAILALKIVPYESKNAVEEANALKCLDHENIIKYFGSFLTPSEGTQVASSLLNYKSHDDCMAQLHLETSHCDGTVRNRPFKGIEEGKNARGPISVGVCGSNETS